MSGFEKKPAPKGAQAPKAPKPKPMYGAGVSKGYTPKKRGVPFQTPCTLPSFTLR